MAKDIFVNVEKRRTGAQNEMKVSQKQKRHLSSASGSSKFVAIDAEWPLIYTINGKTKFCNHN